MWKREGPTITMFDAHATKPNGFSVRRMPTTHPGAQQRRGREEELAEAGGSMEKARDVLRERIIGMLPSACPATR